MSPFRNNEPGPGLIAAGVVLLLANVYLPAIPVISGMALIAMGATLAVVSRFRFSPALQALVAAHVLVYFSLYLLFIGAVLHAAFARGGVSFLQVLDLALSLGTMVAAIRIAFATFSGDGDAPTR